jgi:hypothetical protein
LEEARGGDPQAAKDRLELLKSMAVLAITKDAESLASQLLGLGALPQKAAADALHIALAATHGIDFLLTWNCRHLANAIMRPQIEAICRTAGLKPPIICTPEELAED